MSVWKWVVAAVLVGQLGACAKEAAPAAAEGAEVAEIGGYSAAVPAADAALTRFVAAWKAANEKKELGAYRAALTEEVVPALDAFIALAEAMPVTSEALKAIHGPLVAAYREARGGLATFASEVSEATLDAEYAKVLEAMEAVKKAEAVYLGGLKAHYARHHVSLEQAEVKP